MQDVIRPAPQPNLSQPYLIEMMAKVSRSFAVVVAHLEAPLNYQLATAYLICRVVDNIEDCGQPAIWKQAKFEQFQRMLEEPVLAAEVLRQWQGEAWPGLTADETALMGLRKGLPLWQIFAALPDGARATIAHWAATMARGMWQMEEPGLSPLMVERAGVRLLTTEEEYNQYCYFVAGTVGHLGTEIGGRALWPGPDGGDTAARECGKLWAWAAKDQYCQRFCQRPCPPNLLLAGALVG
jgi:farnesyl-diphosphate farnesyltransferase